VRKPINKWTIVFWVAASVYVFEAAEPAFEVFRQQGFDFGLLVALLFEAFRQSIFAAGVLAGLGVLIELMDQIRWDALHRKL
jgi:hypothetical protein